MAISVPEAIHALSHAPLPRRQLAARALCSMIVGEVQVFKTAFESNVKKVLEELLDEQDRKHPEFGASRFQKHDVLRRKGPTVGRCSKWF